MECGGVSALCVVMVVGGPRRRYEVSMAAGSASWGCETNEGGRASEPVASMSPSFRANILLLADYDVYRNAPRAGLVVAVTPYPEVVPARALEIGDEDPDLLEIA